MACALNNTVVHVLRGKREGESGRKGGRLECRAAGLPSIIRGRPGDPVDGRAYFFKSLIQLVTRTMGDDTFSG
jgi:hypothetical protein